MTASPVWFGPAERPLFGWLHTPRSGRARGGVVICPPFIREHLQAHYTLRLLAEALEAREIAVLRMDYDGMGDSAGDIRDPNRVGAWLRSIHLGMELLSGSGVAEVSLVGMRIGATLAARAAADHGPVGQLVLWDPCESGRRYLREQTALASLGVRHEARADDGSVDLPGLRLGGETVRELQQLGLDRLAGPVARRVLVLTRAGADPAGEVMARLGAAGVEHREATGQAELLDAEMPHLKIPYPVVSAIADWLEQGASTDAAPVKVPPPADRAIVGAAPDGRPIVERPIRIPPAGLFGMVTEVPGEARAGTVPVFINVANGHHVGPNRMWVELARRLAGHGISSVRVDLSGLGESPLRDREQERFVARSPEAFVDVADVARAVAPADPRDVVLVGLCASAYQAIDSALELHAAGVVALNPVLTFVPPELERHQPLDGRRRAALPRTPLIQAFHHTGRLSRLRERFPNLGWWLRLRAHPRRRPASWLRALVGGGTHVLVVTSIREVRPFWMGSSRRLRARLERTGRFRFVYTGELDHGFIVGDQREMIADLVTAHLVDRLGSTSTRSGEGSRQPARGRALRPARQRDGWPNGPPDRPTDGPRTEVEGGAAVRAR